MNPIKVDCSTKVTRIPWRICTRMRHQCRQTNSRAGLSPTQYVQIYRNAGACGALLLLIARCGKQWDYSDVYAACCYFISTCCTLFQYTQTHTHIISVKHLFLFLKSCGGASEHVTGLSTELNLMVLCESSSPSQDGSVGSRPTDVQNERNLAPASLYHRLFRY